MIKVLDLIKSANNLIPRHIPTTEWHETQQINGGGSHVIFTK